MFEGLVSVVTAPHRQDVIRDNHQCSCQCIFLEVMRSIEYFLFCYPSLSELCIPQWLPGNLT